MILYFSFVGSHIFFYLTGGVQMTSTQIVEHKIQSIKVTLAKSGTPSKDERHLISKK